MNDRREIEAMRKACEKKDGCKCMESRCRGSRNGDYEESYLLGYNTRLITCVHSSILLRFFDTEDGSDICFRNVVGLIFNWLHGFITHKIVFISKLRKFVRIFAVEFSTRIPVVELSSVCHARPHRSSCCRCADDTRGKTWVQMLPFSWYMAETQGVWIFPWSQAVWHIVYSAGWHNMLQAYQHIPMQFFLSFLVLWNSDYWPLAGLDSRCRQCHRVRSVKARRLELPVQFCEKVFSKII
jgi:hypothetical protein